MEQYWRTAFGDPGYPERRACCANMAHKVAEVEYLILEKGGKVSVVADSARAPPSEPDLFSDVIRSQTRAATGAVAALT
jgi:hypothetical protein